MCDAHEITLLQCNHGGLRTHNCGHHEDVGVKCSEREERLLNIGVDVHTALITWRLQNSTLRWPTSYVVKCFNERHCIEMSVNNAFSVQLMGLIPSISYNCCVSAVYESYVYTPKGGCIEAVIIQPSEAPINANRQPNETSQPEGVLTTSSESPMIQLSACESQGSDSRASNSSSADTIGGVLGFIIAILLILLAISGATLVYLLRLKFLKFFPKV